MALAVGVAVGVRPPTAPAFVAFVAFVARRVRRAIGRERERDLAGAVEDREVPGAGARHARPHGVGVEPGA
jgi:hypothetical protein